ncbi:MAG: hypothetical protein JWN36_556 [Microbacteriaceae bacterium]|nr:hypothetical protein [Microbacteriaceae bacterium]
MAGRHAPARVAPPTRSTRGRLTKFLATGAVGFVIVALAAALMIPVGSASANLQTAASLVNTHTQAMDVAADVTLTVPPRDGFTTSHVVGQAGPSTTAVDGWAAPITVPIVSPFGPRAPICTAGGCSSPFHKGDDFAAACGTPFYAASAGTVVSVGAAGTLGQMIVIQHPGGIETAYAHMFANGVLVGLGEPVSAGQNIGLVGSSGDSTGCHLYFQYSQGGAPVDPVSAMAAHGITLG